MDGRSTGVGEGFVGAPEVEERIGIAQDSSSSSDGIWTEPGWQEHWVPMVELEWGEGWLQGSESCELEDPHA